MNALAADQAKRFASIIHDASTKGQVRVGLLIYWWGFHAQIYGKRAQNAVTINTSM